MKKYLIPIIFFVLCLGTVVVAHRNAVALGIACATVSVDSACVVDRVSADVMDDPQRAADDLVQLASLRRMSLAAGDFRAYSTLLHMLGSTYFSEGYAFSVIGDACPPLLKDGCIHGYVMAYVAQNGMGFGKILCAVTTDPRVRFGCMHGLGHSYLESTHQDLSLAVTDFCGPYQGDDYLACVSGLFHEYTKGGEGMGMGGYYDRARQYVPLPCSEFSGNLLTICYGAEGSFRQYYSGSEPLSQTYAFCGTAPTADARNDCRMEADERIYLSQGYSSVAN